jgi:hypothetical protein
MASKPCTNQRKSPVSSHRLNVRLFPRAICNACRAGGACLLACRPRTWLSGHAFHCRSREILGALPLVSQSSPFFSTFLHASASAVFLSTRGPARATPSFAVACRFVPGVPCCLGLKLSLRLNQPRPCIASSFRYTLPAGTPAKPFSKA